MPIKTSVTINADHLISVKTYKDIYMDNKTKDLKTTLIRLGNTSPNLRKHLRPILDEITKTAAPDAARQALLKISDIVSKVLKGYNSFAQVHTDANRQTLHGEIKLEYSEYDRHLKKEVLQDVIVDLRRALSKYKDSIEVEIDLDHKDYLNVDIKWVGQESKKVDLKEVLKNVLLPVSVKYYEDAQVIDASYSGYIYSEIVLKEPQFPLKEKILRDLKRDLDKGLLPYGGQVQYTIETEDMVGRGRTPFIVIRVKIKLK